MQVSVASISRNQCCGLGSSYEFSEIQIRIKPIGTVLLYLSKFGRKKKQLKFIQKEEFLNYLPFSISYYSPTLRVHICSFIFC